MNEYLYSVTSTYDNALDAVSVYLSMIDHGFALEHRTVNLSEPSGKMHTKVLYRSGLVGGK